MECQRGGHSGRGGGLQLAVAWVQGGWQVGWPARFPSSPIPELLRPGEQAVGCPLSFHSRGSVLGGLSR
jgi:hypothetical protein